METLMNRATTLMLAGMVAMIAIVVIGLIVVIQARLTWQQQRHPPMPPQASNVGELSLPSTPTSGNAGLRQTTYRGRCQLKLKVEW